MFQKVVEKIKDLQFSSSFLGLFINPLYIARANLYKNIKKVSYFITGNILDVGCGLKTSIQVFSLFLLIALHFILFFI